MEITEDILALSWKQPYGDMMPHGKIETRTWSTKYRGKVLICASQAPYNYKTVLAISGHMQAERMSVRLKFRLRDNDLKHRLNNGKAIAVGDLVGCREMRPEDEDKCFVEYREPWMEERKRKNGTTVMVQVKLYCLFFENVRRIKPFPFKGAQKWAKVTEEQKKMIEYI